MNYYNEIKNRLIDNETYARVKDYSKERHKVLTYYEIGKLLNDAGTKYGESIIKKYSIKLMSEVGKKYNERTLFRMKQFYNVFKEEKVSTLSTLLNWSHYSELLCIKDKNKLMYYLNIVVTNNLSVRELREKIKSNDYERLPIGTKNKLINKEETNVKDLMPNPIIIKNKNNIEVISEKVLQQLILENIPAFLDELGSGFSFIKNEYKIKIGNRNNYIDLLLFNIEFNCYVVVELKVTELKKEHLGQIQVYMNYIDENLKKITQDKTIGIIICKQNNKYVIKYCSDDRIIARAYELV